MGEVYSIVQLALVLLLNLGGVLMALYLLKLGGVMAPNMLPLASASSTDSTMPHNPSCHVETPNPATR